MLKDIPMLELTVAVHLSHSCVQKFLAIGFLHCLIKIHSVQVRSGQGSKGVLHIFLCSIVLLVHRPILLMIVLFILHSTERLFQV